MGTAESTQTADPQVPITLTVPMADYQTANEQRRPEFCFVNKPSEEWTCAICTDVLWDAVELAICDHLYCRTCITEWLKRSVKCPQGCQKEIPRENPFRRPHRTILEYLANLQVFCPEEGCHDTATISTLNDHRRQCRETIVVCDGCDQGFLKREKVQHDCLLNLKSLLSERNDVIQQLKTDLAKALRTSELDAQLSNQLRDELHETKKMLQRKEDKLKKAKAEIAKLHRREEEGNELRDELFHTLELQREKHSELGEKLSKMEEIFQEVTRINAETQELTVEGHEVSQRDRKQRITDVQLAFTPLLDKAFPDGRTVSSPTVETCGFLCKTFLKRNGENLGAYLMLVLGNKGGIWEVTFLLSVLRETWSVPRTYYQYNEVFDMEETVKGFDEFCPWGNPASELVSLETKIILARPLRTRPPTTTPENGQMRITYSLKELEVLQNDDEIHNPAIGINGFRWKPVVKRLCPKKTPLLGMYLVKSMITEEDSVDATSLTFALNPIATASFPLTNSTKVGGELIEWDRGLDICKTRSDHLLPIEVSFK